MSRAHPGRPLTVKPGDRVRLDEISADPPKDAGSEDAAGERLQEDLGRLEELQARLYAEGRRAVVVVLQGMDAAGKDGTVKHVFRGLNPMGCEVHEFKQPSYEELRHDFIWRAYCHLPLHGHVGIWNRSHYEAVLVERVHKLVPKHEWKKRYAQINTFEGLVSDMGTRVVKFFLHIDRDEQRTRLEARLKDPNKNYKYNQADLDDRKRWGDFQDAYADALEKCSTDEAPWHVVPANQKWYRDLVIARTLVGVLTEMDPKPPTVSFDPSRIKIPR